MSLYPSAVEKRATYGVGAHLGAYYHCDNGIGLGAMVKSPVFFPQVNYNATTPTGQPDNVGLSLNAPMFVGLGGSYSGLKGWLFAVDVKYAIYQGITGYFGDSAPFNSDGLVHGLGYQNAWAFSAGVQYELVEKTLTIRGGVQLQHARPLRRRRALRADRRPAPSRGRGRLYVQGDGSPLDLGLLRTKLCLSA